MTTMEHPTRDDHIFPDKSEAKKEYIPVPVLLSIDLASTGTVVLYSTYYSRVQEYRTIILKSYAKTSRHACSHSLLSRRNGTRHSLSVSRAVG
eukprot:COSAG02_NODE_56_length_43700_cov_33.650765_25_plen_93_part_00